MARVPKAFVGLALLSLTGLLTGGLAGASGRGAIPVVPVYGKAVGHGLSLYVHVYYAKGGVPGPPPGRGGPPGGGTVDCADVNTQGGYAAPFAGAAPITMHLNDGTVPAGLDAAGALATAASQWNGAVSGPKLITLATDGTETLPAQDGTSTIGWVRIVPRNVLAATWTWVDDSTDRVVEADLFFNSTQPWATLASCPTSPTGDFDVADIGTHEMGHVLGLSHYSDAGAQATMYPSAPPDEVRKVTLTAGDVAALELSLAG